MKEYAKLKQGPKGATPAIRPKVDEKMELRRLALRLRHALAA